MVDHFNSIKMLPGDGPDHLTSSYYLIGERQVNL